MTFLIIVIFILLIFIIPIIQIEYLDELKGFDLLKYSFIPIMAAFLGVLFLLLVISYTNMPDGADKPIKLQHVWIDANDIKNQRNP